MNARLALLSARRTAHALVLAALVLAAWIALGSGTATDLATGAGVRDGDAAPGAWIEAAWTAFLALVAPCVVLRAASLRSRGEYAWASVSRTGRLRGEASRAAGALVAALAIAGAWSAFVALGPSGTGAVPEFAGRTAGPERPLLDHDRPLNWRAAVPSGAGWRARVEVSLVVSPGGGGEARLVARRVDSATGSGEARALVLPRGGLDVVVPDGTGDVEFELSLPEPGARGYVASDDVTLWREASPGSPAARVAARVALALAAWTVLAFGLGAWLNPLLALGVLASAWCAIWWSDAWTDAPRWLPGASLAQDLAIAAQGRAPAGLAAIEYAAALAAALLGLALCRRGPEGRP